MPPPPSLSRPHTHTSCRTNKVSRYIHPRFSYILLLYLKGTTIKRITEAHKRIHKYVTLFYHLLSLLQFHSFSIKIQEEFNKTHLQISSISYKFSPVLEEFIMDCVSCLKVLLLKNDGFLLFGCFKQLVNVLGLFLLFRMGFKFLKFSCSIWGLLSEPKNGFCSRIGFNGKCNSKLSSCKCELLKLLWNSIPPMTEKLEETKKNVVNSNSDANEDSEESDDDRDSDDEHEHEVFDVMTLRKLVKKGRAKANAAHLELEKERMASSTAAEEAMAMILRLQNEKSLIELEANHYRRLAEEKQQHEQEVIQSLQWIVMKHESERSVLEERLRICRQKLKIYVKGDDEGDHCEGFDEFLGFSNANFEDDLYL